NPRYCDFARHHGFTITPCTVARANEKGRVESGVGYVKKNFLRGLELSEFDAIQAARQVWLDTIANVRIHGETHRRPAYLFQEDRLGPPSPTPTAVARPTRTRASSQFRVTIDTSHYWAPCAYEHRRLTVKLYPLRGASCFDPHLIARHTRCYA